MERGIEITRIECVQEIGFAMLCEFDKLCKSEGWSYSLAGGTLLGAIREKDFLAWDDDIDVFMLREDYEALLEKYGAKPLDNPHYGFVALGKGRRGITFGRMIDYRAEVSSIKTITLKNAWLDIMPLDNVPDNLSDRKEFQDRMRRLRQWRILFNSVPFAHRRLYKKIFYTPVAFVARILRLDNLICKKIVKAAKRYYNDDVKETAEIIAQGWIVGTVNKATFRDSVYVDFHGRKFPCMPDYNHYLTGQYGLYSIPPEESLRKTHKISMEIAIDEYDEEVKKKLLYYIYKKDIEKMNTEIMSQATL